MAVSLPPIPHKSPLTDKAGRITVPWTKWFEQVFLRIGGTVAPSNTELVSSVDVSGIENDIQALEVTTTSLDQRVDGLELGLGVGRQL